MNIIKKFIRKAFNFAAGDIRLQINELTDQLRDPTSTISCIQDEQTNQRSNRLSFKVKQLELLLTKVEHYQPIYNLNLIKDTARNCKDRCEKIFDYFNNDVAGMRFLDVGSSLGYVSFFLADRHAKAEGWEHDSNNVQVSQLASEINGIPIHSKVKQLNLETAKTIPANYYDAIIVLSVFHHIIHFQGLDQAKAIVSTLLEKCPMLIVELALKGEDTKLHWDQSQPESELELFKDLDVEIIKIGEFGTHLSQKTRPLYVIKSKQSIRVNNTSYLFDNKQNFAYKYSTLRTDPSPLRRYYFSHDYVIKEYVKVFSQRQFDESISQLFNEVSILTSFQFSRKDEIKSKLIAELDPPLIIDFELSNQRAVIVQKRKPGVLLWDLIKEKKISYHHCNDLLSALHKQVVALHRLGLFHNDIRTWNILIDKPTNKYCLIDYALASPLQQENDYIALLWVIYYVIHGQDQLPILDSNPPPFNDKQLNELPLLKHILHQTQLTNKKRSMEEYELC